MAEASASRAALLALRRDRQVIEEGHRFLDEKRVAFAQELLRRIAAYEQEAAAMAATAAAARAAFAAAIARHGLEGVQVYPAPTADVSVARGEQPFLGQRLLTGVSLAFVEGAEVRGGPFRTAEAERCGAAFRALAQAALSLAAAAANLLRLVAEYRRTERRVRAIENIVLPEVKRDERRFEAALEELDQEEVMRSRLFAKDMLDPLERLAGRDG